MRALVLTGGIVIGLAITFIVWLPVEFVRAHALAGLPMFLQIASMAIPMLIGLVFGIRAFSAIARRPDAKRQSHHGSRG